MRRGHLSSSLFVLAGVGFLAGAAPAAATIINANLAFQPAVPTWREAVTVEVRGEANCFVNLFAVVRTFEPGTGAVIAIELDEACIIDPPSFIPFKLSTMLGRLAPGRYTVRVTPPGGGAAAAEAVLRTYELADLVITPPGEAPTDAEEFTFAVAGVTSTCILPEPPVVEGSAISVFFPDDCPLLPPGGGIQSFGYPVGPLAAGDYEIRAFRGQGSSQVVTQPLRVFDDEGCVPSATVLCLGDARFQVTATWEDFTGGLGGGQAVPLAERDDTGLFWFFNEANVELTVKVLNGCGVNDRYWVFIASGSTVEYTIDVTDTRAHQTRTYDNDLGATPELVPDTAAFATCP